MKTTELCSSIGENAVDSRVTVRSCTLSGIGGVVPPTTPLTLQLRIAVHVDLSRTRIGFEVVRHDGLIMFHGTPMADGAPAMELQAGQEVTMRIDFTANLLRGTYRIKRT